jgi:hypothetical protein
MSDFIERANLSGFAVKNSAEKICVGLVRKKTIEQGRPVCERGLVFARFFLLNLGKAASDGDFLLLFSKKRRRENTRGN